MLIEGERWELYMHPFDDGTRAIISFDVAVADEKEHSGYNHGRRIVLPFAPEHVRPMGLPLPAGTQRARELEEKLIAMLEGVDVACRFVGRVTYLGRRELVFQVADLPEFNTVVEAWREEAGPLEAEVVESAGWSFFDDVVRPRPEHRLQIFDRRVIDELTQAGTDVRRLHMLEFTFRGSPLLLPAVARVLHQHNFEVQSISPEVLLAKEPSRLSLDHVWELSREFDRLAQERGVKYEGWGAAIVRPTEPPVNEALLTYQSDGTPCVILCAACLTETGTGATTCPRCERALEGDSTLELSIDEFADLQRSPCPFCRKPRFERASVCPSCRRATPVT